MLAAIKFFFRTAFPPARPPASLRFTWLPAWLSARLPTSRLPVRQFYAAPRLPVRIQWHIQGLPVVEQRRHCLNVPRLLQPEARITCVIFLQSIKFFILGNRRFIVIDFSLMVVGHSASASCSSRPFLFEQQHRLVSSTGFPWARFDQLNKIHPTYNLDDLFCHLNFTKKEREDYSNEVNCPRNFGAGCHAIAWVKKLIQSSSSLSSSSSSLSYSADIVLDAFEKGLVPFLTSLENRPDGVVLGSFQCDGGENWNLPIFILEVHSSPYKNSVSKTAADVLDQLRLLRCFDKDHIDKCVGFTFPKYPTETLNNKTCVTKVTVSFKGFEFFVDLAPLQIGDVQTEIVRAIDSILLRFRHDRYPMFCFIRYSSEELKEASRQLSNVPGVRQVPTKHSILLRNDDTFWKYIPRSMEFRNLTRLNSTLSSRNPMHVTLFRNMVCIEDNVFFEFPAQLPPLTKDEVKVCLSDFMMMTATALIELHEFGFAHLDVRIPNICFAQNQNDYIVKLIDLDRAIKDKVVDVGGYVGEMYATQDGWSASQCDWKQLGLLAAGIIFKTTDHNEIVKDPQVSSDDCLKKLISEGKYLGCKL